MTPSADHAPLAAAKALVPARFAGPPPADHPALRYAIRLCDAGFYWEAHEVLEAVWMATAHNSRDRIALRAIIQLANAGLKLRMGRALAAKRLLAEVAALLPDATAAGCQAGFAAALDAATLRDEVQWLVAELDAPGRDAVAVVPRIPMHKNA